METSHHREAHRNSYRHRLEGCAYLRAGHGVFRRCQLVDLSETGIGISSPSAFDEPPTQITFRVQGSPPLIFQVRPVWQSREAGQHRLGLELVPSVGSSDDRTLKRCLDTLPLEFNSTRRGRRRLWFRRKLKAS